MKKLYLMFAVLFTSFLFSSSCAISSYAIDDIDDIDVFVNDKQIQFEVEPQIINDFTMVPMRAIFDGLGYAVEWNDSNKMIIAVNVVTDKALLLYVGVPSITVFNYSDFLNTENINAFIEQHTYSLDIAPIIIDGNTLVPVRAISEATGFTVIWDSDIRTVVINTSFSKIFYDTISSSSVYPGYNAPTYDLLVKGTLLDFYEDFDGLSDTYVYTFNEQQFYEYSYALDNSGWTMIKSIYDGFYVYYKNNDVISFTYSVSPGNTDSTVKVSLSTKTDYLKRLDIINSIYPSSYDNNLVPDFDSILNTNYLSKIELGDTVTYVYQWNDQNSYSVCDYLLSDGWVLSETVIDNPYISTLFFIKDNNYIMISLHSANDKLNITYCM